jgi:hypothetical protein
MPFHITVRIAAVFQEFTLVSLFFTSVLLHHSMDFRLALARLFWTRRLEVDGFHLLAITLLSHWQQPLPTRRLQIPFSGILDLGHVLGTRRIICGPEICHASCRRVDGLKNTVPPDTYLQRHQTRIRIGTGVGIRNTVHFPPKEAFSVSFSAQLLQDRAVWNL